MLERLPEELLQYLLLRGAFEVWPQFGVVRQLSRTSKALYKICKSVPSELPCELRWLCGGKLQLPLFGVCQNGLIVLQLPEIRMGNAGLQRLTVALGQQTTLVVLNLNRNEFDRAAVRPFIDKLLQQRSDFLPRIGKLILTKELDAAEVWPQSVEEAPWALQLELEAERVFASGRLDQRLETPLIELDIGIKRKGHDYSAWEMEEHYEHIDPRECMREVNQPHLFCPRLRRLAKRVTEGRAEMTARS